MCVCVWVCVRRSREQRPRNRDRRTETKSRDQRTETKEQRQKNRDRRTENRENKEQRTKNREQRLQEILFKIERAFFMFVVTHTNDRITILLRPFGSGYAARPM
jgi:hypothetical protein